MWRSRQSAGPHPVAVWLCLAVLVFAASVQACHVCGVNGLGSDRPHSISGQSSVSSADDVCLICLSSQPATASASLIGLAPGFLPAATAVVEQAQSPSTYSAFALYIRPPPLS